MTSNDSIYIYHKQRLQIFRFLQQTILSLLLAVGCSISTLAQVNAEQVMTIGRNVLSMDDYMLAIQYFNQAIKAKPYLSDPYYLRAIAKINLEDYKGAEDDCSLAIERNKYKIDAYKARGFARQFLGKDSLAIEDYNVGLQHNPTDKYFLFYKGIAQTELKDLNGAKETFSSLLRQYPTFEEGFTAQARLNLELKDTTAAVADLDRAISLSKSLVNPFLLRAQIEWDRREWDKAIEDINAAIRLHPEVADLYVNRAFIRYNSDDFFGAMSDYNYALELEPKNRAALFNRALLRYEVKDLKRAEEDLSTVISLEPDNFHAHYNRGLINLEQGRNQEALNDFQIIAKKYPRFYPVYYAMAEVKRNEGNMRAAMALVHQADELVKGYVKNPEKNPLDRPAIVAAKSNDSRRSPDESETETEVMDRFNQLVTVSDAIETQLSFNEKIRGRVQDRDVQVETEPIYAISFQPSGASLRSVSNYFRELDDLNQQRYISHQFYLTPGLVTPGEKDSQDLFSYSDDLRTLLKSGQGRPVDRHALAVALSMLKNYPEALENLDRVLIDDPRLTIAYMARGFIRCAQANAESNNMKASSSKNETNNLISQHSLAKEYQSAINDFDKALTLNPRLVFAWFNKGNVYYSIGDYTSAMECFSRALEIDPEFGSAYFNRGLAYLRAGNKSQAFADLSKAGELGVLPSYNILKRMK